MRTSPWENVTLCICRYSVCADGGSNTSDSAVVRDDYDEQHRSSQKKLRNATLALSPIHLMVSSSRSMMKPRKLALPLNGCFGYGSRHAKRPIRQRPMELKSTPALRILNITRQLGTLACVLAQGAITVPWHLAGIIIGAPAQLQLTSVSLSHATTVAVDGFEDMNKNEQTTHQEQ